MARNTQPVPVGTSRAAYQAAYEMKNIVVPQALQEASRLLEEYAGHTFKPRTGGEPRRRFVPATSEVAQRLLQRYFASSQSLVGTTTTKLTPSIENEVRALFVLVCEMNGVKGTYGQQAVWYQEIYESRVRLELIRRGWFGIRKGRYPVAT